MKQAVIYYSRTGKTRYVAKQIIKKTDADEIEIKDMTNRSGINAYINYAIDIIHENKISIKPEEIDTENYDVIYIGTPVWASKPATAIQEMIKRTSFKDKKVVTFTTFKKRGATETLDVLNHQIRKKNGSIIKSFAISATDKNKFLKYTKEAVSKL